ncbi:hypothetical protein B6U79_01345 [Candidatus Bathyarchaeota archaeon ex4484_231]|nr:MAG: hypothetical protein B6U79_01345 [Candidatus Bathyarchaeota archaeon ex4484_231]
MVTEVIMPKMGQTMEKGKIIKWLKKEGEKVRRGEPLLEIETDKTTIEVEARGSGILRKILAQEGEEVPIATPIAYIGEEDEPLPEKAMAPKPAAEPSPKEETAKITRLKEEKVRGSGPGGRITKEDVLNYVASKASEAAAVKAEPEFEVVPMTSMRKAIAKKMAESKATVPHFYVSTEVDMTEAVKMRERLLPKFEAETSVRLSFTHLLVKAVAEALEEFPQLNSTLEGENIKLWKNINIGIAVGLEDGLIVPVLRQANTLSLKEIASRVTSLVARAREKRLREDEFTGGTFTISNMGALDVDSFIAIINVPETAILATGRIKDKPVIINEAIAIRKIMTMTLSVDHRVVDGVLAARFLQKVKGLLEQPEKLS